MLQRAFCFGSRRFAALALSIGLFAMPALAHDVFDTSEPAAGAVLTQSPTALTLRFIEPVSPVSASLRTDDGQAIALPNIKSRTRVETIAIPLGVPLPPGSYIFEWTVRTVDHHPEYRKIPFTIRAP